MVEDVRQGHSYRVVARRWQVGIATVALWVRRAANRRLDEVDWGDRPSGTRQPSAKTPAAVVLAIKRARRYLQRHDALGDHGPAAIRRYLLDRDIAAPSERTIARWLARAGLSGREKWRRPPPPKGWYLPDLAAARAELDSCDIVEGMCLRGKRRVEALNTISLWGRLAGTTAAGAIKTDDIRRSLQHRWEKEGCPAYLQVDNDTVFSGAHSQRRYLGRLVHWCLCVGVVPVFAPPYEPGFQAAIEAYNRRWQERAWRRWRHRSVGDLQRRSDAFVNAYNERAQCLAPRKAWKEPSDLPRVQRIILLRRLDADGALTLFAQKRTVAADWAHRLVRCDVDYGQQKVRIYGLRRRDPANQPFLKEHRLQLDLVPWMRTTT